MATPLPALDTPEAKFNFLYQILAAIRGSMNAKSELAVRREILRTTRQAKNADWQDWQIFARHARLARRRALAAGDLDEADILRLQRRRALRHASAIEVALAVSADDNEDPWVRHWTATLENIDEFLVVPWSAHAQTHMQDEVEVFDLESMLLRALEQVTVLPRAQEAFRAGCAEVVRCLDALP